MTEHGWANFYGTHLPELENMHRFNARSFKAIALRSAVIAGLCSGMITLCLFTNTTAAAAETPPVPGNLQVSLIMKILTFDRALHQHSGDRVDMLLLYVAGNAQSEAARKEIAGVFDDLGRDKTISNLPFAYQSLAWESKAELDTFLKENDTDLLYVMPGHGEHIPDITDITQDLDVLSVSGVPEYVNKGISIGIGVKNEKPEIIINLPSARAEGADLDTKLLRIATVITADK